MVNKKVTKFAKMAYIYYQDLFVLCSGERKGGAHNLIPFYTSSFFVFPPPLDEHL